MNFGWPAMRPLETLTADEIRSLSVDDLVVRMDDVRKRAIEDRYPPPVSDTMLRDRPWVRDIVGSESVRSRNEAVQKKIADATFQFLLQLDFLDVTSGTMNKVVWGPGYHDSMWSSPAHWMRYAALSQYMIISSRIALECFFELIHILDTGSRMSGRSKFSTFRKWVSRSGTPYGFFALHVIYGHQFDRKHRTPEVHGTSAFVHSLLRLDKLDNREANLSFGLLTMLMNIWRPLLDIVNGRKPNGFPVFDEEETKQFMKMFFNEDETTFQRFVAELLENKIK